MIRLSSRSSQTQIQGSFQLERLGPCLVITPLVNFRSLPAAQFSKECRDVVDRVTPEVDGVVVDLANAFDRGSCDKILGLLCLLWKQVRRCDTQVALCCLSPQAEALMARTRLDRMWPIYPSRTEALEALARQLDAVDTPPRQPR